VVRKSIAEWNGTAVKTWLESRIVAARADQVAAERYGWERRDDCDMAAAEEMVCSLLKGKDAVNLQNAFTDELKALLDRGEYLWRGVYDDKRFDRHVRSTLRKLLRMTRANDGFGNVTRYQ
jgi:predicted RNase H-like nuclease (RuvC/YqgF family)